jgi:hypothetical protein
MCSMYKVYKKSSNGEAESVFLSMDIRRIWTKVSIEGSRLKIVGWI